MDKASIPTGKNPLMMPVVLISTISSEQVKNFCSIAWISKVNSTPPLIMCAIGPHKKTYRNILETKAFGINVPSRELIAAIDYCGLNSGNKVNKQEVFTTFEGTFSHVPLIESCVVNIECELWKVVETPKNHLVIGEIKRIHADKSILTGDAIDITKYDPVLHSMAEENLYFAIGEKTDEAYQVRSLPEGRL